MNARAAFPLWPRLHQDILGLLDRADEQALAALPAGSSAELSRLFRHLAAVEEYWRRVVLEPAAEYREIPATELPDRAALRARLEAAFAATERLLDGSRLDALAARPVKTAFPVRNALEALSQCYTHSVHHRAEIASGLRSLGVDPGDWL